MPMSAPRAAQKPKAASTKRNVIILVVVLVLLVAGAVTALFATGTIGSKDPEKILATAERYLDEKDYEQAIIQYKKLLEIDPMNVDAYLGLAEAYEGSGDEDEAAEILEKALDKLEDDDKAVRKLEKALDKLDKNSNKDMIRPNEAVGESSRPIDSADTSYSDYSTAEVFIPDADTDVAIPVMPDAPITTSNVATTTTTAVTVEDIKDVDAGGFTPSGNAGTVKFLGYYDITVDQKGIDQINIFESQQYNGKIEWISASSGSAYYEKLAMLIAADDSPDLMTYEPLAFPYGVSRNMFEPLDSYIDIDDALWDDMRDIIDSYEYNDKHYYIPHRITTKYALNYDRRTIADAGLTDPYALYIAGDWTWDTWREMMVEFCNQDDTNIGFYATSNMLEGFINTTGTGIIDVNSDGFIENNLMSADVARAVEYLSEMGRSGLLYPESHPHGDWVSPQMWATCSDKILFLGMEPEWSYIAATETIQNPSGTENDIHDVVSDFAFVPFPRDPDADAYYISSNTFGYMIPKGANNIDGAVEFIYLNRLYETDANIQAQERADHVSPAKVTYKAGRYEGQQKWRITWDPTCYDLWKDMIDANKFDMVFEDMYGFSDELSTPVTDALYASTFGIESWTQQSVKIEPLVEAMIAEYN